MAEQQQGGGPDPPPLSSSGGAAEAAAAPGPRVVTPPPQEEPPEDDPGSIPVAGGDALRGLVVLPPRRQQQQSSTSPDGTQTGEPALALPLIRPEEPVQSIRAALAEVVGLAQITNYRLELESDGPGAKVAPWKPDLISPYTGPDAVVTIPVDTKALDEAADMSSRKIVLDEYGDLSGLVEHGLKEGSAFRMVLQRYDVAAVKDHVLRLRTMLHGNVPSVVAIVDDEEGEGAGGEAQARNESEESQKEDEDAAAAAAAVAAASDDSSKEKEKPELKPLPEYSEDTYNGKDLGHFFYLVNGEDPKLYHGTDSEDTKPGQMSPSRKKKKKGKSPSNQSSDGSKDVVSEPSYAVSVEKEGRQLIPRWNELEDTCRIDCDLQFSGFHPPPANRKFMGDLAYLEMTPPGGPTVHVTATRTGFYVNRSRTEPGGGKRKARFDPKPAPEPCFSHSLLDCLLQASPIFCDAWSKALQASKERADVVQKLTGPDQVLHLFRVAVRADFDGFSSAESAASSAQSLDASLQSPPWLVPYPSKEYYKTADSGTDWTRFQYHTIEPTRTEEELSNTFGVDLRGGGIRDWNEELQLAREMPISTTLERIERARLLHKVLSEFGEASLAGVKAITEGHVAPMNPNETMRTQVYLHNNIFFSRAIDAGPETFKLAKGDRAAKKCANRDLQCNSILHRMERSGISTLATVLIDFLGTRFICQSILPGILIGERAHKLLLGAVESGIPLKWDADLHKLLEEKIGESMMVASRPVLRNPLTDSRLEEIAQMKKEQPVMPEQPKIIPEDKNKEEEKVHPDATMMTCVPVEAKGILGSDQRRYVLDFGRLTPRDANWLPEDKGGTGNWEAARKENGVKSSSAIPSTLEDDEWSMMVLRPELVTRFTQLTMTKYLREKNQNEIKKSEDERKNKEDAGGSGEKDVKVVPDDDEAGTEKESTTTDSHGSSDEKAEDAEKPDKLTEEDLQYLKSLRMNVNVFLPHMRRLDGIDGKAAEEWKQDEERVRAASTFLWEEILPKLTAAVKSGSIHQLPVDGKTLTEFLHRNGVNCRYLGRLAILSQQQEAKDAKMEDDLKNNRLTLLERRTMPKCWLELLECEMVARAAKHVLNSYFLEHGGAASAQPAQTIASFLSALVSESEETAAETERRLEKRGEDQPDEDDYGSLTICDTGGDGDALPSPIRSRYEVWQDIELEVGRRFRYSLTLFNTGNKSRRTRHIPLLRRVCQRTGIRLVAKNYDVGGKCLCSGGNTFGGRLTGSYPISPVDIVDLVPLMKHAAAYNEGFYPCCMSPLVTLPPLQVSLQDARVALENAHVQTSGRALNQGLELAQEALNLYQRVTESPVHPGVVESIELMATIFLEAGDLPNAIAHGEKALHLAIQTGGFDTANIVNAHLSLFQMKFAARDLESAVKHLRAVIYLLEVMTGPDHVDIASSYHKLATAYSHADYHGRYSSTALHLYEESSKRDSCDRLMHGITQKHITKTLASMGRYKEALESEKKALQKLSMFVSKDHQWTKESLEEMGQYAKLAEQKGNRVVETEKMRDAEAKAAAAAAALLASEEDKSKSKNKGKKKKGKK